MPDPGRPVAPKQVLEEAAIELLIPKGSARAITRSIPRRVECSGAGIFRHVRSVVSFDLTAPPILVNGRPGTKQVSSPCGVGHGARVELMSRQEHRPLLRTCLPTIADALLDRLTTNLHRIELNGESMRKVVHSPEANG